MLLPILITEIITIQLSNSPGRFTLEIVSDNCVSFAAGRARAAQRRAKQIAAAEVPNLEELFGHLTPAQYAFLGGVLAILAEHGEEALTKSCEMVLQRFGRGNAC